LHPPEPMIRHRLALPAARLRRLSSQRYPLVGPIALALRRVAHAFGGGDSNHYFPRYPRICNGSVYPTAPLHGLTTGKAGAAKTPRADGGSRGAQTECTRTPVQWAAGFSPPRYRSIADL